jgi:hypothetical protein
MEQLNHDPNGISTPSEYRVHYVRLYTHSSEEPIDITNLINYVEIFESIYSPFLTVNVNITDNQSLTSLLPLIGEELIELDVRGADNVSGILGQTFYIYKLSDRLQVSDKTFTYTLNCISPSAIFDMNLKVSQAFNGQPADIVKEKMCASSLSISKPVYAHPTKNVVSYISNYWSPMQNIKYLCDRSVSADTGASSYLFFETKKGFNFVPIDSLVGQESSFDYYFSVNTHNQSIVSQQQVIQHLYVDQTFNYIDRIMSGAYGNRALFVDGTTKSYQYMYYDFLESYSKFSRLNENAFSTDNAARRINSVFRVRDVPSTTANLMPDEFSTEWFRQRLTELAAINSQSLYIDAVGRFNMSVGNVINVFIPTTTSSVNGAEQTDLSTIMDKSLSGRYLITGLKHMLDRERHTVHIQASKDSMVKLNSKG